MTQPAGRTGAHGWSNSQQQFEEDPVKRTVAAASVALGLALGVAACTAGHERPLGPPAEAPAGDVPADVPTGTTTPQRRPPMVHTPVAW